jgi:hypothetical protein
VIDLSECISFHTPYDAEVSPDTTFLRVVRLIRPEIANNVIAAIFDFLTPKHSFLQKAIVRPKHSFLHEAIVRTGSVYFLL